MELKRIYNRLEKIRETNPNKSITYTIEFYDTEENMIGSTKHFQSIEEAIDFLNNNFKFLDLSSLRLWLTYSIEYNEPEFLADVIFIIINNKFKFEFI